MKAMFTYDKIRDLILVIGIIFAGSQLYQTQRSLEIERAGLLVAPYLEARTELLYAAARSQSVSELKIAVGRYTTVAAIMCKHANEELLDEGITRELRQDVQDIRDNPTVGNTTPLDHC